MQRFHVLQRERHARKFDEIASMQKFPSSARWLASDVLEVSSRSRKKLFGGAPRGGDSRIPVRCSCGRCRRPRWRTRVRWRAHQRADILEALQSDLERQRVREGALPAPPPAPNAIGAQRRAGLRPLQAPATPSPARGASGPRISRISSAESLDGCAALGRRSPVHPQTAPRRIRRLYTTPPPRPAVHSAMLRGRSVHTRRRSRVLKNRCRAGI